MSSDDGGALRWEEFAARRPDLATAGGEMLYQFGVGLAFLSTVRADGGPRVHPFCPLLRTDGLFAFIVPSPKRTDLHRDGRYAMHSFPREDDEDAFYLTGTTRLADDDRVRVELERQFANERPRLGSVDLSQQELFEFLIETAMHTTTTGHGDPEPHHTVWQAPQRTGSSGASSSRGRDSQAWNTER